MTPQKVPRINPEEGGFGSFFSDMSSGAAPLVGFLQSYWLTILLFLIVGATVLFMWKKLSNRRSQIEKLWIYILFFLTKRQMLIPLVITLAKKDDHLDEATQTKLLKIREDCRNVSLKKSPHHRMELEEEVSQILFSYFSTLEKDQQIKEGSKFEKIVKDLEFIDAKLVQLQKVYNHEVSRWNKLVTFPVGSFVFRLAQFNPFQQFKS